MTEAEKDAFIVQLRGEVTRYRDAYRATMRMLELSNKELRNLRELRNMKENAKMKLSNDDVKEIVNKVTNGGW